MPNDKASPNLFENQNELPEDIRRIVADYSSILEAGEVDGYSACEDFLKEARELGYTFERPAPRQAKLATDNSQPKRYPYPKGI